MTFSWCFTAAAIVKSLERVSEIGFKIRPRLYFLIDAYFLLHLIVVAYFSASQLAVAIRQAVKLVSISRSGRL